MRQILSTLIILTALSTYAQETGQNIKEAALKPMNVAVAGDSVTKAWKFGGFIQLNVSQVALVNWAAGGQNSIAAQISGNAFAHYLKGRLAWDNDLNVSYGIIAQGRLRDPNVRAKYPVRKNVDLFWFTSKVGYVIDKKKTLTAAFLLDYKTSMTNGYSFTNYDAGTGPRQLIATPFSPSFLTLSLGINYKPVPYFSVYLSPVAGKMTFVGHRGKDSVHVDETRYGLEAGKSYRAEFGAYLRADFQKDIFKNINLKTSVELFQNYLEKDKTDALVAADYAAGKISAADYNSRKTYDNRKNTDINWITAITFKVNKWFSASLETQFIYDHDTAIPKYRNDNTTYLGRGPQFREALSLSVGYKF
ncbi:MAG: DUF3078 domain-containing protein [Chitinophagales bacterium]